jgi:RHS repeat-associated protein
VITSSTTYWHFRFPLEIATPQEYRFGFQGQLKDNEWTGTEGSHLAFKYRVHDARIGRFLSIDPLTAKYPHNSPYAFSENRVIDAVELEGLEKFIITGSYYYGEDYRPELTLVDIYSDFLVVDNTDPSGQPVEYTCGNFVYCDFNRQMEGFRVEQTPTGKDLVVPNLDKNSHDDHRHEDSQGVPTFESRNPNETPEFSIHTWDVRVAELTHVDGQGSTYYAGFGNIQNAIGNGVVDDIDEDGNSYDAISIYMNPSLGTSEVEVVNALRENGVSVENTEIIFRDSPYLEHDQEVDYEFQFFNYECDSGNR